MKSNFARRRHVVELPDLDAATAAGTPIDYKAWKGEQGAGEEIGPTVRVAGRIMLLRSAGKLFFPQYSRLDRGYSDFDRQGQVSDQDLDLVKLFDFGDLVGIDGRLGEPTPAS